MDNQITFTIGQLLAIVGIICLVFLTIYLIGLIKELRATLQEFREVGHNVNEMLDDIQTTKMVITSKISELKKMSDVVKRFKEMKEKREAKKLKKEAKNKGAV